MRGDIVMKKDLILILILIIQSIFLVSIVSATPVFQTTNNNPQPQETIIATISTSGTFLDEITTGNLKFYEGQKQIFPEFELYNFENIYYMYITFNKEGTFRIESDEILYALANEVSSKVIQETFNVKYNSLNNETGTFSNLLSVKPGVIYTLSSSSELSLINRGDNDLSISIQDNSFIIGAFQAKIINLNLEERISYININSYKNFQVPVIYLGEIINTSLLNNTNETEIIESNLLFRPFQIDLNLSTGEIRIRNVELSNNGQNEITNLTILTESLQIEVTFPEDISAKTSINLSFKVTADKEDFNEVIIINYQENNNSFNLSIPVNVKINEVVISDTGLSCLEHGGTICEESCRGESNFTKDGACCYGECIPFDKEAFGDDEDSGSFGLIIGILIFLVLGIIGFLVYKKHKKIKPKKPEEKLEESKEKFEKRLQGGVTRH